MISETKRTHLPKSFGFFNATQFLGALNDNLFKLLVIYYLISVQGAENKIHIVAAVGVVFVIPFLLFNAVAGVLADRVSKRTILVAMKGIEIGLMALGTVALYLAPDGGDLLLVILGLMGAQSALFSPAKYGIMPELLRHERLIKVGRRGDRLHHVAVGKGDPDRVADEHAPRHVLAEHDVVLGVSRRIHDVELAACSERDSRTLVQDEEPILGDRVHRPPQRLHTLRCVDALGRIQTPQPMVGIAQIIGQNKGVRMI